MKQPHACAPLKLLPLMLAAILSACATKQTPLLQPLIPPLPAALTVQDLSESQDYSARARAWLKKAQSELRDLRLKKQDSSKTPPT